MRVRFVTQPFVDGFDLYDFVTEVTADHDVTRLDIVVAWAKRSGLRLVEEHLQGFRARGGHLRVVLGISEGGATRQGLELVQKLADEAYVYHQRGRTFHPKVFAAGGEWRALVLVGSSNLTRGGLSANFEAGLLLELDLHVAEEAEVAASIESYVERLVSDTGACHRLDDALYARLTTDPRYLVGDEDKQKSRTGVTDDSSMSDNFDDLFSKSGLPLRAVRPRGNAPAKGKPPVPAARGSAPPAASTASVEKRWYKTLPRSDAQRLPGSHPSGHVTLVQARHSVSTSTYFRDELFDNVSWATTFSRGKRHEEAIVPFQVVVDGVELGEYNLKVRHTPKFASGQGNRTTVLHWGPLREQLSIVDRTGQTLTIERLDTGAFRLTIGSAPTGPFIA